MTTRATTGYGKTSNLQVRVSARNTRRFVVLSSQALVDWLSCRFASLSSCLDSAAC